MPHLRCRAHLCAQIWQPRWPLSNSGVRFLDGDDIDRRKGLSATAVAEVFWGLTPIYWKAVATVSTHELLALRVLWAIPFAVVLLTLWG